MSGVLGGCYELLKHNLPALLFASLAARMICLRRYARASSKAIAAAAISGGGGPADVRASLVYLRVPRSGVEGMATLFSNDQILAKAVKGQFLS